jgi:hypothetical protein
MNSRITGVAAVLLFLGLVSGQAQSVSPNADGALIQRFPLPTITPPLNSGMPYDVMIGYIMGDSLARGMSRAKQDSMLRDLTYSDTLKYALKYLYEMADHDPIRFYQWGLFRPVPDLYPSSPAVLRNRIVEAAVKLMPDSSRTAVLCSADIIAQVKVSATQGKIDTMASFAKHAVLVTSSVVEPIKGGRIPNCQVNVKAKKGDDRSMASALAFSDGDQPATPGACLQFEYRLEWPRLNHSGDLSSLDETLVAPDGTSFC